MVYGSMHSAGVCFNPVSCWRGRGRGRLPASESPFCYRVVGVKRILDKKAEGDRVTGAVRYKISGKPDNCQEWRRNTLSSKSQASGDLP